ncbi:MAG: Gfo/Idh/MocA family oxidoreductase [Thermomicrobiales bacterium]|nr:Gfo/Idh/MocA family oxidoreductase [Thermomicrobiales bacterium]
MAPVRFIVTGLGSWGPGWAELIQQQDGVELAAVVEPMDDRRQAVVEARGLTPDQAYSDLQTALDHVETDAVLVVTPPNTHLDVARIAFAAQKPVLMEKPLAASMDDARALVELAEETGNLLIVSQNYRYRPPMQAVRKLLQDGVIGDILHIQANCQEDMRLFYEATNFRYLMPHPHIIDMTIHHWDLLRYLTGHEVDTVYATSWNIPDSPYQTDAACAIILKLDDGTPVLYEGSSATHRDRTSWSSWWEFEGTNGRIWTDGGVGDPHVDVVHLHMYGEDPVVVENITVAESDRHGSLLAFVSALQGGELPAHTGRDNLNSLATVMACVESVEQGRIVSVGERLG